MTSRCRLHLMFTLRMVLQKQTDMADARLLCTKQKKTASRCYAYCALSQTPFNIHSIRLLQKLLFYASACVGNVSYRTRVFHCAILKKTKCAATNTKSKKNPPTQNKNAHAFSKPTLIPAPIVGRRPNLWIYCVGVLSIFINQQIHTLHSYQLPYLPFNMSIVDLSIENCFVLTGGTKMYVK